MKDKIKITENGNGKESVQGEEPATNYIKSDAFQTVTKYFTIFPFIYFLYSFHKNSHNFIVEIEWETC